MSYVIFNAGDPQKSLVTRSHAHKLTEVPAALQISLIWLIYYYYPLAVKILKFKYMNEKAKPVIMITIGNLVGLL